MEDCTGNGSSSESPAVRPSGLLSGDDTALAEQMARIVHELRSPLANAAQAVEYLELTADQPPDPTVLQVARRQLDSGLRRVEQLLLLLRDEAGRGRLEPSHHRLRDLVVVVTDDHDLAEAAPRLHVDIDPELWVAVDPNAFTHILENLIHNATRHSPKDTAVRVLAEARGAEVLLRVIDGGPGIDPALLDHAFEPFTRGAGGGAGLGLTIVRHLVEAHDGRVWIEIDPEATGTCLVVALPTVEPAG